MDICRCEVADVKMQVEINFLRTPTILIVSNFSLRAGRQRGLMSTKRNPVARNVNRQTLRSNCNVGLCWANHFTRNASGKTLILHMLAELFYAICMSAVKNQEVVCLCKIDR